MSLPLLSHTPHMRRTGGSRGATQRGVRFDLGGVFQSTLRCQGWTLVRFIFIFYPVRRSDDCIILELKVDKSAKEAVRQIKDRQYALRFQGKMGEEPRYTGRVLAVGIAYHREDKKHSCIVEVL